MELTKDDCTALRMADSAICFYQSQGTTNEYGTGKGVIRCFKKQKQPKASVFTSAAVPDAEYCMEVSSKVRTFFCNNDRFHSGVHAYYHHAVYNGDCDHVQTLIAFLKPGDFITLEWRRGNGNNYTKDAGLFTDELLVKVGRGKQSFCFLIAVQTGKDNTARMTQF